MKKKHLFGVFSTVAFTALVGAVAVNVRADVVEAQTSEKISLLSEGAQVKYISDEEGAMRFNFSLTQAAYNEVYQDGASKVGVIMAPTSLLGDQELTLENVSDTNGIIAKEFSVDHWTKTVNGDYEAYAYVENFTTAKEFKSKIAVIGYYQKGTNAPEYTASVERSMTYVAATAVNGNAITPEQKTMLDQYLVDCTVTVDGTANTVKAGTTYTLTASPESNQYLASWNVNGVSVSTDDTYSFIVTEDVTVTSTYDTIVPVNTLAVDIDAEDLVYTGNALTPAVTLSDAGTELVQGTDYSLEYTDNVNAGTATVTITGLTKKYTGETSKTFTIDAKTLTDDMISVPADLKHSGRAVKPTPTVIADGVVLSATSDYTVSYEGDTVNLATDQTYGEATVTVEGTGNYQGTASANYRFNSVATQKRIDGDASDWSDYTGSESVIYTQNGAKGVRIKAKMESDGIYVYATANHATLVSNSGNPKMDTALEISVAFTDSSNTYVGSGGAYLITNVGNYKEWATDYSIWHGDTESAFVVDGTADAYTTSVEAFIPVQYFLDTENAAYDLDTGALKDGVDCRLGFSWLSQSETETVYVWGERSRTDWLPTNRWTDSISANNVTSAFYYLDEYTTDSSAINRGLRLSAQVTQDFAVDGNDGDWATYNGNEEVVINQGNTKGMNVKAKWGSDGIYVLATTRHATRAINTGTLSNDTRLIVPLALQNATTGSYTSLGVIWATATGNYKYWDTTSYNNGNYAGVISAMKTTGTANSYVTYTEVFIPNTYINSTTATAAYFDADGKALETTNLRMAFAWGAPGESEYIFGMNSPSAVWGPMKRYADSVSETNVPNFYYLDTNSQKINRGLRYSTHVASDFAVDGDVSDWESYTGTTKTTTLEDGRSISYRAQYGTDGVYFSVEALINNAVIGNLPSTVMGTAVKNFWSYWSYQTNMELTFGGQAFKMVYGYVRWGSDTLGIVENAMRVTEKDGKDYVVMELFIPYAEYTTLGLTSSDGKTADMTTWVFGCKDQRTDSVTTIVTEYETYKYENGSAASSWAAGNYWFGGSYQNTKSADTNTYFEIIDCSTATAGE